MQDLHKKVVLLGRPNVGKSTLFNRLTKGKQAIVDKTPGVTRDRNYGLVQWQGFSFILVDTGGFQTGKLEDGLIAKVRHQAEIAVEEGDIVLFVVDFKDGVTPCDLEIADFLRRSKKRIIPIVNKVDDHRLQGDSMVSDFYRLGLEGLIPLSALHGLGIDHLLDVLKDEFFPSGVDVERDGTKVAIIGRPNVGKSSLLNCILGEERTIVDEHPGTTRDPIDTVFYRNGQRYILIDTAGIRRKGRVGDRLERFSIKQAIKSLRQAHLVLLLVEAMTGITRQDKRLLRMMESSGCGGIIVANKWDQVTRRSIKEYRTWILEQIPFFQYFPVAFTSALTGEGIEELLHLLEKVSASYSQKIPTSALNQAIQAILSHCSPAVYGREGVKLYYATQKRVKPPSFILFVNHSGAVNPSYLRYIENGLRKNFGLIGTPLRFEIREG